MSTLLYEKLQPNSTLLTTEYITALKARTNYMFCASFFHIPQNCLIFFGFNLANHTLLSLYGEERGINTFQVIKERGVIDEAV